MLLPSDRFNRVRSAKFKKNLNFAKQGFLVFAILVMFSGAKEETETYETRKCYNTRHGNERQDDLCLKQFETAILKSERF